MLRDALVVVIAGLLAFALLHDWVRTRFGPTPAELAAAKRARVAEPSLVALRAVDRYMRLAAEERSDLAASLHAGLVPVRTWVARLDEGVFQVICLGEDHEESTRDFLARELFTKVSVDMLLLEVTPEGLERIDEAMASGGGPVRLLGADVAAILEAARARNAAIEVAGIEETKHQRLARRDLGRPGFRDDSIARNFRDRFRRGRRHVVLIGALHCTDQRSWLFARVRSELSSRTAGETLSVRVVGQHQSRTVADFVHFLDRIGFPHRDFVIVDPRSLHPLLEEWFRLLVSTLRRYDKVIVFRD